MDQRLQQIAGIIGAYCFTLREFERRDSETARSTVYEVDGLSFGAGFGNAEVWANWKGVPCFRFRMRDEYHRSHFFKFEDCADRYNSGDWESVLPVLADKTADMAAAIREARKAREDAARAEREKRFAPMETR